MKKQWIIPMISINREITPAPSDDPVIGEGSGQSTTDDVPWDYETWSVLYDELDVDGDGEPATWEDYVKWMTDRGWENDIRP